MAHGSGEIRIAITVNTFHCNSSYTETDFSNNYTKSFYGGPSLDQYELPSMSTTRFSVEGIEQLCRNPNTCMTLRSQTEKQRIQTPGTLGARDFSSAVSGFCQVFIVTRTREKTSGTQGKRREKLLNFYLKL